jgi:hypothetical protein
MNSFCKLIRNTYLIFGQVKNYFFITKFQLRGLLHDYGLLWIENAPRNDVFQNEDIECFVNKYLTTDQTMFKHKICNMQIHQHKRTCRKKFQTIVISKTTNETHTKTITFKEENCISKHRDISIKIYKKLIDMGLGEHISFVNNKIKHLYYYHKKNYNNYLQIIQNPL